MKNNLKDLYNTLELDENATKDDIKNKYREKCKKAHPDINKSKNAEEEFKKINKAYMILMDDEKKANYEYCGDEDVSLEDLAIKYIVDSYITLCGKIGIDKLLYINISNTVYCEFHEKIKEIHKFHKKTKKFLKKLDLKEKQCEIKNEKLNQIFSLQRNHILQQRLNAVKELRLLNLAEKLLDNGIVEKELNEIKTNYNYHHFNFTTSTGM